MQHNGLLNRDDFMEARRVRQLRYLVDALRADGANEDFQRRVLDALEADGILLQGAQCPRSVGYFARKHP